MPPCAREAPALPEPSFPSSRGLTAQQRQQQDAEQRQLAGAVRGSPRSSHHCRLREGSRRAHSDARTALRGGPRRPSAPERGRRCSSHSRSLRRPPPEPRAPGTSESSRAAAAAAAKPRPATPPPRRPQRGAPPPRRPLPARAGRSSQLGEGSEDGSGTEGGSGEHEGPEQGSGGRLCLPSNLQGLRGTKVTFVIPWPLGRVVSSGPSWGL